MEQEFIFNGFKFEYDDIVELFSQVSFKRTGRYKNNDEEVYSIHYLGATNVYCAYISYNGSYLYLFKEDLTIFIRNRIIEKILS